MTQVKYKMEKRAWDGEAKGLRSKIAALTSENKAYREAAKSKEFEAQIEVRAFTFPPAAQKPDLGGGVG